MVNIYQKNKHNVGTVGARLHFENNRIQHAGMLSIINPKNTLIISHLGLQSNYNYSEICDVIGNTAAFLLISKNLFNDIGGFNENYIECFEDVELNLECLLRNKRNIFVGNAVCYHYESVTRGKSRQDLMRQTQDYKMRIIPFILDKDSPKINKYIKTIKK